MELYIYETSDVHGYLAPTDYRVKGELAPYGLARVATLLAEKRRDHERVVLLDNGDLLQGSAMAQYLGVVPTEPDPAPLLAVLGEMGYDAAVIGNHEFNYGRDYLARGIASAGFPVLGANILNGVGEPAFGPGYMITDVGGVRVGVLGLITSFVPMWEKAEHIQGLTFADAVETAAKWVPYLQSQADVVIVAYHGGFARDPLTGADISPNPGENVADRLLAEVAGIDVLLTGHQHREMALTVAGVPVVMPGSRGAYVGEVKLTLGPRDGGGWQVEYGEAALLSVADYAPDEAVLAMLAPLSAAVEEWLDQPLAQVVGGHPSGDPVRGRMRQDPYVALINHIQRKKAGVDISATTIFTAQPPGFGDEVTVRDIVNSYVYPNTLAVLAITGADLRAALERCAGFFALDEAGEPIISQAFSEPFIQYYNYDIYDGIDYTMDIRKAVGERLVQLDYHGQPVADDDMLQIVLNNYRAIGGGAYPMYQAEKITYDIQMDMTDLIVAYLLAHPVIKAEGKDNFRVIYRDEDLAPKGRDGHGLEE